MQFDNFSFGSIRIDGSMYEHDVVIDRGEISTRKKKASKQFREEFGHTPLSAEENIPWKCRQLVVGSGAYGKLPVMQEVRRGSANRPGHQGFGTRPEGYQRHPPRAMLVICHVSDLPLRRASAGTMLFSRGRVGTAQGFHRFLCLRLGRRRTVSG